MRLLLYALPWQVPDHEAVKALQVVVLQGVPIAARRFGSPPSCSAPERLAFPPHIYICIYIYVYFFGHFQHCPRLPASIMMIDCLYQLPGHSQYERKSSRSLSPFTFFNLTKSTCILGMFNSIVEDNSDAMESNMASILKVYSSYLW